MTDSLQKFLATLVPVSREEVSWLGGSMRLGLDAYVTAALPPLDYITSVRAILTTQEGRYALLRNSDGVHILPGGRREASESLEATLRRELVEETGCCSITVAHSLGFLHFHHLTAKPEDYPYPYPDFCQAVFAARGEPDPAFRTDRAEYERSVEFVMLVELPLALPAYQRLLAQAAAVS